jgi:biotin transport system substrate-specific component
MSYSSAVIARPAVLAELWVGHKTREIALVILGAAWVAVLGQVSVPLGFTPVPLSLGTFAALTAGAALGPVRAAASMALFMAAGLAGAPVFVGAKSGLQPTFGYVIGYLAAAVLVGYLASRRADRKPHTMFLAMLAATAVLDGIGVTYLAITTGMGSGAAIKAGLLPFIVGDVIKAAAAAGLFPTFWAAVRRSRSR